ncbi:MAG TPA: HRDC domain-containing protein [Hyphomicrobiaceae bacterium]|nr:HRDC domain-containing protein [Hyphomicrobiaceae bacterium]
MQLTDQARPLLRSEMRFPMRRAPVSEKPAKGRTKERVKEKRAGTRVHPQSESLFQALKLLRIKLATEGNVPPYVIFHDRTIAEIAEKRPATPEALGEIIGLGERKVAKYGAALLEIVTNYPAAPPVDTRLSATVNATLGLYRQGMKPAAIARERTIEVSTVKGHLAEAIRLGLIEAADVLDLDSSELDQIEAAFERHGTRDTGDLGPVHAALRGQYDHGTLKCVLAGGVR